MANADDKKVLGLLRKTALLADLPAEPVSRLLPGARVESFRPRQVIYLPGDKSLGVHFIAQGRVKVSKVTRDGKELTLAQYNQGADIAFPVAGATGRLWPSGGRSFWRPPQDERRSSAAATAKSRIVVRPSCPRPFCGRRFPGGA